MRSALSLAAHAPECAVTLLDNGSPPAARAELERRASEHGFAVVALADNSGFTGGMNHAVIRSSLCDGASFALISCHGVEVTAASVDRAVAALESEPSLAAVAPIIRGDTLEFFGADAAWRDRPGASFVETERVSGALLVVRVSAFRAIGGFDDRFFAYYEDIDLSLRLREAGWKIGMLPDAEIIESGSTLESFGRIYLIARNSALSEDRNGEVAKLSRVAKLFVASARALAGSLSPLRSGEQRGLSRLFARGQFLAAVDALKGVTGPGRAFGKPKPG